MNLSDIIRQHVSPLIENKNGWYSTRCMVCHDHAPGDPNFKGFRGNFKLDNDIVGYNCYNCDHRFKYNPNDRNPFSKNAIKTLESFGIPESEYSKILLDNLVNTNQTVKTNNPTVKYEPEPLKLPKHFYTLKSASNDNKWKIISEHYLNNRLIDPNGYNYYLSTGEGKFAEKWKGRIIIPFYKDGNLIFYQGRALLDSMVKKYESPSVDKGNILYNFDEIFKYSESPLFIVEGFFDAHLINGIALFGKNITNEQSYWINRSNRTKVIIPDKFGDGKRIALQALNLGWSISTPNFGICKDVNEAVIKYGRLYVINEIMKNIYSGESAKIKIKMYCK